MLLLLRKFGLTSLFKEVGVFKVCVLILVFLKEIPERLARDVYHIQTDGAQKRSRILIHVLKQKDAHLFVPIRMVLFLKHG